MPWYIIVLIVVIAVCGVAGFATDKFMEGFKPDETYDPYD